MARPNIILQIRAVFFPFSYFLAPLCAPQSGALLCLAALFASVEPSNRRRATQQHTEGKGKTTEGTQAQRDAGEREKRGRGGQTRVAAGVGKRRQVADACSPLVDWPRRPWRVAVPFGCACASVSSIVALRSHPSTLLFVGVARSLFVAFGVDGVWQQSTGHVGPNDNCHRRTARTADQSQHATHAATHVAAAARNASGEQWKQ